MRKIWHWSIKPIDRRWRKDKSIESHYFFYSVKSLYLSEIIISVTSLFILYIQIWRYNITSLKRFVRSSLTALGTHSESVRFNGVSNTCYSWANSNSFKRTPSEHVIFSGNWDSFSRRIFLLMVSFQWYSVGIKCSTRQFHSHLNTQSAIL